MSVQRFGDGMGQSFRSLTFITYVLAFHLAWACWPYFLYPRVVAIGETTLAYALVNIGIRTSAATESSASTSTAWPRSMSRRAAWSSGGTLPPPSTRGLITYSSYSSTTSIYPHPGFPRVTPIAPRLSEARESHHLASPEAVAY